jgi:hypothetical protein
VKVKEAENALTRANVREVLLLRTLRISPSTKTI